MVRQATKPVSLDCLGSPDKIRELREQAGSTFQINVVSLPASDQFRVNDHIERLIRYLKELKEPTARKSAKEAP
ncbi:MAG: hypothetical protein K8F91_04635 [Candidatus Obscuribacterales bacterium]|nr:hypothetical protein [Candidatus Obscuribacterales bacterium]